MPLSPVNASALLDTLKLVCHTDRGIGSYAPPRIRGAHSEMFVELAAEIAFVGVGLLPLSMVRCVPRGDSTPAPPSLLKPSGKLDLSRAYVFHA
jgi:hypothetical protein